MELKKKHLVIDCRMINKSGIGTYLKNILPGIIFSGKFNVTCMGYIELKSFQWIRLVDFIILKSSILSFSEQIEMPIKIPKCDIIWSPNWNIPLLPIKAKTRVVTIHDVYHLANPHLFSFIKISIIYKYMTFINKKYNNIITVSEFSKNEIIKFTKILPEKIAVVHLGIEENFNEESYLKNIEDEYILFVGNVKPHKNLKLSLDAFSKINNKKIKFYIVGQRDGFITGDHSLNEYILNLKDRVFFTGYVSDNELKNYYKNATLFLFPSLYEGFGLPILEAMKFNLPIIASKSASIPEVAGNNVIYFNSSSVNDLIEKIDLFLLGKIVCPTNNYKNYLLDFDWKKTILKHTIIFDNA